MIFFSFRCYFPIACLFITRSSFFFLCVYICVLACRIHRGTPQMYDGELIARRVVLRGMSDSHMVDDVPLNLRVVVCVVLTHQVGDDGKKK